MSNFMAIQFRGTVYENGWGQVAKRVMTDRSIKPIAKAIYAYLCSFAGGGLENDRSAFPSISRMMADLDIKSEETFNKYMKQLKDAGYVTVERNTDERGRFANNLYIIESIVTDPSPKKSGMDSPPPKISGTDIHQPPKNRGRKNSGTNKNMVLIPSSSSTTIKNEQYEEVVVDNSSADNSLVDKILVAFEMADVPVDNNFVQKWAKEGHDSRRIRFGLDGILANNRAKGKKRIQSILPYLDAQLQNPDFNPQPLQVSDHRKAMDDAFYSMFGRE